MPGRELDYLLLGSPLGSPFLRQIMQIGRGRLQVWTGVLQSRWCAERGHQAQQSHHIQQWVSLCAC